MSTDPCSSTPARMRPSTCSRDRALEDGERHPRLAEDVAEQQARRARADDRHSGGLVHGCRLSRRWEGGSMLAGPGRRRGRRFHSVEYPDAADARCAPVRDASRARSTRRGRPSARPARTAAPSTRSTCAMIDTAATTSPEASRTGAATENAPRVSSSTDVEMPIERISARRIRSSRSSVSVFGRYLRGCDASTSSSTSGGACASSTSPTPVACSGRRDPTSEMTGTASRPGEPLEVDRPEPVAHREVHVLARGLEQVLEVRERRARGAAGRWAGGPPAARA